MRVKCKKFIVYITRPSMTSFGDHIHLPLWRSVLADWVCLFALGIYKPRKKTKAKKV